MEDERLGRLDRDDRRRVRRAVEDRQLAEELARAEDRDDRRLGALVARQDDLDRAAGEDEQRIARVALVEDGLAPAEPADRGGRRTRASMAASSAAPNSPLARRASLAIASSPSRHP